MKSVDDVEASPLVGGKGSEDKVWSEGCLLEGLVALVNFGVEFFELGAHAGAELVSGHGLHAAFAGAGISGS